MDVAQEAQSKQHGHVGFCQGGGVKWMSGKQSAKPRFGGVFFCLEKSAQSNPSSVAGPSGPFITSSAKPVVAVHTDTLIRLSAAPATHSMASTARPDRHGSFASVLA